MSALALGEDLSPRELCRASCCGVSFQISHQGDILAAFHLSCLSFTAGELASTRGLMPGVAFRAKRSPDACLPNPCQHQGQCQVAVDGAVCSCKPGFTGEFCQGRAANAGEPSPVCPWAPEGRVMGTVHWCSHCSPPLESQLLVQVHSTPLQPYPGYVLVQDPATGHFLLPQKP